MKFFLKEWRNFKVKNFIKDMDKEKIERQIISNTIVLAIWLIIYLIKEVSE